MKKNSNGLRAYLITWAVSVVLAVGIAWGVMTTHTHDDYMPRAEMEQIVLRLDTEITRLHEEINRLYELK